MVSSGVSNNITAAVQQGVTVRYQTNQNDGADFSSLLSSSVKDNGQKTLQGNDKKSTNVDEFVPKASPVKTNEKINEKTDKRMDEKTDSPDVSDKEKLNDIASKIKDKIKEKLNVTDEDIDSVMAALNLVITDLLDADNLSDVIMQVTGSDGEIDLLVSDGLSQAYTEILDFAGAEIESFLDENPITQTQLDEILESIKTEAVTAENKPDVPVKPEAYENMTGEKQDAIKEAADDDAEIVNHADIAFSHEADKKPSEYSFSDENSQEPAGKEILPKDENMEPVKDGTVNLAAHFDEAIAEVLDRQGLSEQISPTQIIDQIIDTAKVTINRQTTSMEMTLNPESLGKINLNISVREGVVTANIVAQNEVVKEAIESQILTLKENFNEQGIKVEAVTVTVESHTFNPEEGNGQTGSFEGREDEQKKNHRPLRLDSLDDLSVEELTDDERLVLDMMSKQGNQVNFTA